MDLNDSPQVTEDMERTSAPVEGFRQAPVPEQKPKKSKASLVLGVLLLIALLACGVLAWMMNDQSGQKSSLQNQLSIKDSQISELKSELKSAEDAVADGVSGSGDTTTDTSSNANDTMLKMAFEFATAKIKNRGFPEGATDLRGEIDKQTAEFTRIQVGSKSAGPGVGLVYFKKVGSEWVLLGDDNGNQARFNESFGMPSGF